jgi:hypothetical protein
MWPAFEKRQSTKSRREEVRWRCRGPRALWGFDDRREVEGGQCWIMALARRQTCRNSNPRTAPMVTRKAETFQPVTLANIRSKGCQDLLIFL